MSIPPFKRFLGAVMWVVLLTVAVVIRVAVNGAELSVAPETDRVGFPAGYMTNFTVLRTVERDGGAKLVTIYGNALAASVTNKAHLPYPMGSVIVMETCAAIRGPGGGAEREATAGSKRGAILGLHVMRRGPNFGAAYGDRRSGEWEYVEYRADGSYLTPPQKSSACAECHRKAGPDLDFVYKARLSK